MAFRFFPSDVGDSIPGSSFSTPPRFNSYQFGGTISGSSWENSSFDVRKPAQEITRADIDWRYEHEARVMREPMRVNSIESTPAPPFINSSMFYLTHRRRFGYEQRNPFIGYPVNGSAFNSMPWQRQETGNFTGYENQVFSHYASSRNRELDGIRDFRNSKPNVWSRANVEGNIHIMKLPEADFESKLTTVRASLPESEIPRNIPFQYCPEGSHEGKKSCYGSVTSGNEPVFYRPQASITMRLPSDNHSLGEISIEANFHYQKEEQEGSENPTNVSAEKVFCNSVNSESHLLHQIDNIESSSPGGPVCSNGTTLPENSKKRKKTRKSKKKKTHSSIETQLSMPGDKAVEELKFETQSSIPSIKAVEELNFETQSSVPGNKAVEELNFETQSSVPGNKAVEELNVETQSSIPGNKPVEELKFETQSSIPSIKAVEELNFETQSSVPGNKAVEELNVETQSSIPGNKPVEELTCSFSKAESASLCSVEAHVKGMKHNSKGGGSSIATRGIKKVKDATKKFKKFKEGMKTVKKFKRVSKRYRNHGRSFWCEMCNVGGINDTEMLIHRNGRKHLKMLRKNHGGVLVVSSNQMDKGMIS